MNKLIAKATRTTYHDLIGMTNRFIKLFHILAKEQCEFRGEICTCYHKDNEHLISVIGGPVSCKPNICPYMRKS